MDPTGSGPPRAPGGAPGRSWQSREKVLSMNVEPAVQARKIVKSFGDLSVLSGLDLEVERGSVYGLVGRNGAGKTTLFRILVGLEGSDSGEARVLGKSSFSLDHRDFSRIGYQAHGMALFPAMSLAEHARYFSPGYPGWDAGRARALADRLEVSWSAPAGKLSAGDRQKACLVLALAHRPELLVLDEPAATLDAVVRRTILEVLIDHVAEGETTILVATHVLTDLERLADKIGFLSGGKIILEMPLDRLKETVVKLRLTFPDRIPEGFKVPKELCREETGRDLAVTVSEPDEAFLAGLDPGIDREVIPLGLEDIFVAVTTHWAGIQSKEARHE
jgi:ABC-2 type transport system ATP-binding protein